MTRKTLRLSSLLLILVGLFVAVVAPGAGLAASSRVDIMHIDGVIVPVVGDYVDRGIRQAEANGASAVIIELSTPGGDYATTQRIVGTILNSKVPVIVYVSPSGGWAGSAGTFITLAAHIAAMAPGSRIGAAHPVTPGTELTPTEQEKITNDAAAFIRSIAILRGRDPDRAESAVRQSRSFSVDEALDGKLIDLRADSLTDLLTQVDGRKVAMAGGQAVTLSTTDVVLNLLPMNGIEAFLQVISNPNIAYILLTIGSIGIIAELYNPGAIFPGVIGGISLLVGFYSLGVLNAYWGGVLMIMLAFGLLMADVFVTSHGILTAGGIATLVMGSLVLFSGSPAAIQVNRGLIAGVTIAIAAFFVFIVAAVVRRQRRKAVTGREGLMGQTGIVATSLDPEGVVSVDGERWTATSTGDKVEPGEELVVAAFQ